MLTRRSILLGLIAAPVVVRMGLIMPVRMVADDQFADLWVRNIPMQHIGDGYEIMASFMEMPYLIGRGYRDNSWVSL